MGNLKKKSVVLLSIFIFLMSFMPTFAYALSDTDYTIINPYAEVKWDAEGKINYKANLHCHSWASDGMYDVKDIIEKHYDAGYDALALTDHGTVNYGWTTPSYYELNVTVGYLKNQKKIKNNPEITKYNPEIVRDKLTKPTYLTNDRYEEIINGTDRNGVGMIDVYYGNENNYAAVDNAHVNTYFVDYGHGIPGTTSDYETPLNAAEGSGGLSVINHPSEITGTDRDDITYEEAYNEDNIKHSYYIDKFANLLKKYPSCLGIEINTKNDGGTKYDRKLWDILLQKVAPSRNVYGICSGDTHKPDQFDQSWIIYCTNKKITDITPLYEDLTTEEAKEALAVPLRECLETGAFFGGSRNIDNEKELADFGINAHAWKADPTQEQPNVTSVDVKQKEHTITIEADNVMKDADGIPNIIWIADGEVVAKGNTIDLDDHSDKIGSYVRAEILGAGGVLYSQPFLLSYEGAPETEDEFFFDFNNIFRTIKFIFNECLNLADWKILNGIVGLFM